MQSITEEVINSDIARVLLVSVVFVHGGRRIALRDAAPVDDCRWGTTAESGFH
jgi:hypothetical protein